MTSFLIGLIPSFIFLGNLTILSGLLYWFRSKRKGFRCPLTRDLLRGPGQSLFKRIEDLNLDIDCYATTMATMPLLLYASYLSRSYFGIAKESDQTGIIYGLIWLAFTLYFGKKLQRALKERDNYRLGLDCEMAVGQELNNLTGEGYRVYHDVPAEGFNIDHVVVGRNGVFAVETKGRSKPSRRRGSFDASVVYDGRTLRFPDRISTDFLDQARRQAEWLSRWLTEVVGELVPVQPVLVIPGWYVERVRRGDVLVLNGKNDYRFIASQWTNTTLSTRLIQSVGNIIEQVCRDVEPMAYKPTRKRGEEGPQVRPRRVFGRVTPIRRIDRASTH
jgi:hypothetical protein